MIAFCKLCLRKLNQQQYIPCLKGLFRVFVSQVCRRSEITGWEFCTSARRYSITYCETLYSYNFCGSLGIVMVRTSYVTLQFWLLSKINRSRFFGFNKVAVFYQVILFTLYMLSLFCCPHSLWKVIHPIHPDTQSRPGSGFMPHCQRLPLTWSHPRTKTTWHLWSNAWLSQ